MINGARGNAVNIVLSNIYTTSILASCLVVLVFFVLGFASPMTDKFLAFGESVIMLYLGGPTALALMKLLLQTTPDVARSGIESRLFEVKRPSSGVTRHELILISLYRYVKIPMLSPLIESISGKTPMANALAQSKFKSNPLLMKKAFSNLYTKS